MEKIRKNIEDERLRALLMGFGMGLGFGMSLYGGIKNTKKQADMGYFFEEKSLIVGDAFSAVSSDFQSDDFKDIITSDSPINMDTQDNCIGMTDFSCDSPDVKDTFNESVEPQKQSVPKKESFEETGQLLVDESQREETNRSNVLECASCFSTYKSRSALNKHHRDKFDCRLRICKEPHDHEYTLRKFSDLEEAMTYCATLGKFLKNGSAGYSARCGYCRNRKRLGCKASWGLKRNGFGDFVFTGCLKHVDSCMGMGEKRLKQGRKPSGVRKKRIRKKNFICDKCEYKGTSLCRLKMHIKSVHDKIKDNVCHECGYACSEKKLLDKHINSVHLKLKNYVCEECGSTFFNNAGLQLHRQSVHLNMRSYSCEQCAKAFNTKSSLNLHRKIVHLKIKNYVCQYCEYAASTKGNLKKHKVAVHKVLIEGSLEEVNTENNLSKARS